MGTFYLSSKTLRNIFAAKLPLMRRALLFTCITALVSTGGFFAGRGVSSLLSLRIPLKAALLGASPEKMIAAVSLIESRRPELRIRGYYMLEELSLFDVEEKLRRLGSERDRTNRVVLLLLLRSDKAALRRAREIVAGESGLSGFIDELEAPVRFTESFIRR